MPAELERQPLGAVSQSRINQLKGRTHAKVGKPAAATKLPSIMSIINQETAAHVQLPRTDTHGSKMARPSKSAPECDFDRISEKLRIRMQLAYYKFKTKQGHLKFRQLQSAAPVVTLPPPAEGPQDASSGTTSPLSSSQRRSKTSRRLVGSQGTLRTPVKPRALSSHTLGTRTAAESGQNTPMSVEAARSLIDLFTSQQ
ncbi:LAQU0S09e02388g1_1 [Lachancea quebecensis]|uniref:LAQU0S09e02388g1_1 n=1 Tax=Lachancea quebecensis TaxID=1654605 RepID=A0A0P1KVR3_9SACH|nr:LAQU0S09e02388g1_1 [Lachancea quebecensis]